LVEWVWAWFREGGSELAGELIDCSRCMPRGETIDVSDEPRVVGGRQRALTLHLGGAPLESAPVVVRWLMVNERERRADSASLHLAD